MKWLGSNPSIRVGREDGKREPHLHSMTLISYFAFSKCEKKKTSLLLSLGYELFEEQGLRVFHAYIPST